jgi:hypothetical protein
MSIEEAKKLLRKVESLNESEKEQLGISIDNFFIVPNNTELDLGELWENKNLYIDMLPNYTDYTIIGIHTYDGVVFGSIRDLSKVLNLL